MLPAEHAASRAPAARRFFAGSSSLLSTRMSPQRNSKALPPVSCCNLGLREIPKTTLKDFAPNVHMAIFFCYEGAALIAKVCLARLNFLGGLRQNVGALPK